MIFVKIFQNLLQSSLWASDPETCKIWITILCLTDQDGIVHATAPGIANEARVSLKKTREVLQLFEQPDPDSRSPENEGRRIERTDGGYIVLNYLKYRAKTDAAHQRAQTAARVFAYREHKKKPKKCNAPVTLCNAPVTPCNDTKTKTKTKTKTETKIEKEKELYIKGEVRSEDARATLASPNSPGLRTSSRAKSKPTAIGDIIGKLMPASSLTWNAIISRIHAATNDVGFRSPGWRQVVENILPSRDGAAQLETLLDRIEKDVDPRLAAARDHDVINNPKKFASHELKRIEKIALAERSNT
jgi:hypothetical protein